MNKDIHIVEMKPRPLAKRARKPQVHRKHRKAGKTSKKTKTLSQLKNELWVLCKKIVRERDGNTCFICGKTDLEGSGWHTGHFLPSSSCGAFLRFDLRNIHSSCYYCNINLGGNGSTYYVQMVKRYGQEFVDRLFNEKEEFFKAGTDFYLKRIESYHEISSWDKAKLLDYTKILTKANQSAAGSMPM